MKNDSASHFLFYMSKKNLRYLPMSTVFKNYMYFACSKTFISKFKTRLCMFCRLQSMNNYGSWRLRSKYAIHAEERGICMHGVTWTQKEIWLWRFLMKFIFYPGIQQILQNSCLPGLYFLVLCILPSSITGYSITVFHPAPNVTLFPETYKIKIFQISSRLW